MQSQIAVTQSSKFFVLGTAKAGTSSLHYYLSQHPDIALAQPKETWFFDGPGYDRGLDYYFDEFFRHWQGQSSIGEVASSYLYVPYVAERLQCSAPDAKLIAILRDPVDRAFSDWWMLYSHGIEELEFEEAVDDNLRRLEAGCDFDEPSRWAEHLAAIRDSGRLRYRTYLDYGYYVDQIERFLALYPADQLKVVLFEDLVTDPTACVRDIWKFLGLNDDLLLESTAPKNVAVPSQAMGRMIGVASRQGLTALIPEAVKRAIRTRLLRASRTVELKPDTHSLLRLHFSEKNARLGRMIGRDLDGWMDD